MSRPEMTDKEKADSYLLEYLAEIQRGNRYASDLSGWLVESLTPEALAKLAQYWDDGQDDAPGPWVIQSERETCPETGEPLFWNNADGWGDAATADRFTDAEKQTLNLPIGGAWVRMEGGSK